MTTTAAAPRGKTMFDLSEENPLERVKKFWAVIQNNTDTNSWGAPLMPLCTPISSTLQRSPTNVPTAATTTFSLTIPSSAVNVTGNLHGDAAATLIDMLTTAAIAPLARKGAFEYPGVSRTLNVGYLKPVKGEEEVEVVCEAMNVGRRVAAVRCVIRREADGEMCVEGTHHKVSTDPAPAL